MKNKFWIWAVVTIVCIGAVVGYLKLHFVPDLLFTDLTVTPGKPVANIDTEKFSVKIENLGTAKAGSFEVCLMENGNILESKTIDGLDKGESVKVEFYYKFKEAGKHVLELVVDCNNKIREKNKLNNKVKCELDVREAPIVTATLFKKKLGNVWYGTQFSGSSPAIYNGKLYVGGKNEYFFCLNKDTGEEIWSYKVIGAGLFPGIFTTPVFYKGNVYFGSTGSSLIENGGHIFALNAENGSLVWKYDTAYDVHSISLDDGKIYAYDGNFTYTIDAVTGKLVKKYEGTVIAHNGKLYSVDYVNGVLSHIDPLTGKVIWSFKTGGEIYTTPAFYSGKIYIDGKLCLDEEKGTFVWKNSSIGGIHQAFDNGLLFVGGEKLYCVVASSGQINWEKAIGTITSPVAVNGKVYVAPYTGNYEKEVFCINRDSPYIIAIYEVGDVVTTAPLVYEGKIYVVGEDGYLYCFKEE
jgi:outer membrane protein assembly factor BamB